MPPFNTSCQWTVKNSTRNTTLSISTDVADSFLSRLKGLIPRQSLKQGEGLIITRCKSIHMMFMKFAIDAVFVSKDNIIVGLVGNIKPNQFSKTFWSSSYVIELPSGVIQDSGSRLGDALEFFPQNVS